MSLRPSSHLGGYRPRTSSVSGSARAEYFKNGEKQRGIYSDIIVPEKEAVKEEHATPPATPQQSPGRPAKLQPLASKSNGVRPQGTPRTSTPVQKPPVPQVPVEAIKNEPKVMIPFKTEPGRTPRKIKIERYDAHVCELPGLFCTNSQQ